MPVLIELLRDVPHIEFDKSLAWNGALLTRPIIRPVAHLSYHAEWSLPDQLVFSTVSALLRISSGHRQHTDQMVKGIKDFVEDITNSIKKGDGMHPAFPNLNYSELACSLRCSGPFCSCTAWTISCCLFNTIPLDNIAVDGHLARLFLGL